MQDYSSENGSKKDGKLALCGKISESLYDVKFAQIKNINQLLIENEQLSAEILQLINTKNQLVNKLRQIVRESQNGVFVPEHMYDMARKYIDIEQHSSLRHFSSSGENTAAKSEHDPSDFNKLVVDCNSNPGFSNGLQQSTVDDFFNEIKFPLLDDDHLWNIFSNFS